MNVSRNKSIQPNLFNNNLICNLSLDLYIILYHSTQSIYPSIRVSLSFHFCGSLCTSIHLCGSLCTSIHLFGSLCASIHLFGFLCLTTYSGLSVNQSIRVSLSINLFGSFCLSIYSGLYVNPSIRVSTSIHLIGSLCLSSIRASLSIQYSGISVNLSFRQLVSSCV